MGVTYKKKEEVDDNLDIGATPGKAFVSTSSKAGETHEEFNLKEGDAYEGPTCSVGFKVGYTKNLGNYESMRIDVSVNMPCYPSEMQDVFAFCKQWVDDKMDAVVAEVEEDIS